MRNKILISIVAVLMLLVVSSPTFADLYQEGGITTDTNCNQAKYFAIGKICADIDDGKLYKGTGAAVEEVGGAIDLSAPGIIGNTTPAAGTFTTLKGKSDEIIKSATGTLTAAEMSGQIINNYGQTADTTMTMDAGVKGATFPVLLGTTVDKYWRLDPDASNTIYLDGTSCGAGKYVGIASAVAGAAASVKAFQTGATTFDFYFSAISGAWACEP